MRHATAGGAGGGSDHERALSSAGRAEASAVGARLQALDWVPSRAIISSARRCQETWSAVAEAFPTPRTFDARDAIYNAGPAELAHTIAGEGPSELEETLLLLAHNPGVSVLAFEFVAGRESNEARLRGGFSPGSFACFEVDGAWSELSRRNVRLVHFERPEA